MAPTHKTKKEKKPTLDKGENATKIAKKLVSNESTNSSPDADAEKGKSTSLYPFILKVFFSQILTFDSCRTNPRPNLRRILKAIRFKPLVPPPINLISLQKLLNPKKYMTMCPMIQEKNPPSESTSSTTNEGDGNEMVMHNAS